MLNVKERQKWLEISAKMLSDLCAMYDCDEITNEHDKGYSDFIDDAAAFSVQFKHAAKLYDDPEFANALNNEEIRAAAIARKIENQAFLNDFHVKNYYERWNEKPVIRVSEILRDCEMSEQMDDARRAVTADAQIAECNRIIEATGTESRQ